MQLQGILPFAHSLLSGCLKTGDIAVDGTMGNGNDTLFLAQLVGETGKVYAFDIQAAALLATERRLREADVLTRVSLIQVGHENLAQYVPQNVAAAVFNFGYLPRGNHAITTLPETSLQAIQSALNLLKINGLLVLVVYHGHEMGKLESHAINHFVEQLPQNAFRVLRYEFVNQANCPPYILAIEKLSCIVMKIA
ncbi:class I SAM-dependent methyltransferase [Simonsiella muelleri]|uniref:class I SAM-dependent methyltransferase n=2 Tax=Simonsiella muelleri TaxID=72 RepID=UPI0028D814D4|nr:class I SAM-dependent methyltransferase [Simonsiella muelleri]